MVLFMLAVETSYAIAEHNGQGIHRNAKSNRDRVEFVYRLLEISSAAREIKNSNNPDAQALYAEAQQLYQRALVARNAKDQEVVDEALFHATETMFRAVRLVEHKKMQHDKKQQEFNKRLVSINALLKAHERISEEKGTQSKHLTLEDMAQSKIAAAQKASAAGKINKAYKIADEVYIQIKIAISKLRSGDTLVRSLHFATKKDEYLYEIDRNDSHKMLVKLLLKEKLKQKSIQQLTQGYLDKATHLRSLAEQQAASSDYEAAIKSCEDSTRQLVRAIRAAGLFIPG